MDRKHHIGSPYWDTAISIRKEIPPTEHHGSSVRLAGFGKGQLDPSPDVTSYLPLQQAHRVPQRGTVFWCHTLSDGHLSPGRGAELRGSCPSLSLMQVSVSHRSPVFLTCCSNLHVSNLHVISFPESTSP